MRKTRNKIAAVAAIGLVAAGGSAFTAANSDTPMASAGYQGTVTTGFAVSAVEYELGDPTNPLAVDTGNDVVAVQFTLDPADDNLPAKQVRVRLSKKQDRAEADGGDIAEGGYYTCTVVGTPSAAPGAATTWNCATVLPTPLESIDINTLDIVANSQPTITAPAPAPAD